MNRSVKLAVAVTVAALVPLAAGVQGSASAAPQSGGVSSKADVTAPTLKVEPFGRYLKGSQVYTYYGPGTPPDTAGQPSEFSARFYLKWATSDPSGICSQTVTEQNYDSLGGDSDPVLGPNTVTYDVATDARTRPYYVDQLDAQRVPPRYVVRVTDCTGNTATSAIIRTNLGIKDDRDSAVTYEGTWKTARFPGFSGGTTQYSTTAGDTFELTGLEPGPLGLVMETKADRGAVDVFVDGRFRKTVDTGAMGKAHQAVVWQIILKPGQTHTLTVVNKATPGRARVDLDAVLTGSFV